MARQTVSSFLSVYFLYLHYVPPQNINNLSFLAFSVKKMYLVRDEQKIFIPREENPPLQIYIN